MTTGEPPAGTEPVAPDLSGITAVVADPLRFKRQLRMGEDTYTQMRVRKRLQEVWDVGGMVMTGAGAAASPWVASTFFASTGGLLSFIGIGAAATPVGWVIAAGVASGGLYYGVTRWVAQTSRVDSIPHFINTPLDVLAMSLFDLVGSLALRVASIDGRITAAEKTVIRRHLVREWGYDPTYAAKALKALEFGVGDATIKDVARSLAQFQAANPDCNAVEMQKELLEFLRQVISADGKLDEREEHAIEAVAAIFSAERTITLSKLGKSVANVRGKTGAVIEDVKDRLVSRLSKSPTPKPSTDG